MRSGLSAQTARLRAEGKFVTHTGTTLANDLRNDRYRDFLGRFGPDIESERRMDFVEQRGIDTVLGQPRKHRTRSALRSDHSDEAAGLPERSTHYLFVEG